MVCVSIDGAVYISAGFEAFAIALLSRAEVCSYPADTFFAENAMDKNSTYGMKPEQLADLLSLGIGGADAGETEDDKTMAELLDDRLTRALPKNSSLFDSLVLILGRLGRDMTSLDGKSLRDVLLDPESDVAILKRIKDSNRKLARCAKTRVEHDVVVVVYYLAIAGAMVFHDSKITAYSYEKLSESFSRLASETWMPEDIEQLFLRAKRLCQERM